MHTKGCTVQLQHSPSLSSGRGPSLAPALWLSLREQLLEASFTQRLCPDAEEQGVTTRGAAPGGATYGTKQGAKSGQHVLSMDRNLFMQSNRSMFFDRPVLHGRPETTKHLWHGSCYFHDGFMSYDHYPAGIAMILFGLVVIQPESC